MRSQYGESGRGLTYGFPWFFMDCFIPRDPTFMLRIWHGGDWVKRRFGSTQSMVRWCVEVIDLVGCCIWLIRDNFLLFLISNCTCIMWL